MLQGINDRVAVETDFLYLATDGLHVVWVTVADTDDGMTAVEIEIFSAFSVEDVASAATHDVYVEEGVNVE